MIWAIVSLSCFCWLYRVSPSLATKNIINLISVLTIWWCPCVESSLVLLEEGVCYDQCIFLAKLSWSLPCFIPHSKAKFAYFSRCFLTSYFCIPVPCNEKDIFFLGVTSVETLSARKITLRSWLLAIYFPNLWSWLGLCAELAWPLFVKPQKISSSLKSCNYKTRISFIYFVWLLRKISGFR